MVFSKKILSLLLVFMMLISGSMLVSHEEVHAASSSKDKIALEILSDGTHLDGHPSSYINTANGFSVGDDSADDGIVSSGDSVTYQVVLTVNSGDARDLYFRLNTDDAPYLDIDFSGNVSFGSSFVQTEILEGNIVKVHIKRGLSGVFKASIPAIAKDTKGELKENNNVVLQLLSLNASGQVENVLQQSSSRPISVISTVFADLTLDTGNDKQLLSYKSSNKYGSLTIRPYALVPHNYPSFGISAGAKWITDLDVSNFPEGTIFYDAGSTESQNVTEENIITASYDKLHIEGEGVKFILYKLQDDKKPTRENPVLNIKSHLINPQFENSSNKDPGGDKGEYESTLDSDNSVLQGSLAPNNNYTNHRWIYESGTDNYVRYQFYGPRNYSKTIFSDENRYWNTENDEDAYLNAKYRENFTSNNDLVGKFTFDKQKFIELKNTFDFSTLKTFIVTDKNTSTDREDMVSHKYDSKREVVIYKDGSPLDKSKYKVSWGISGQSSSIISDYPPENATQVTITIDPSVVKEITSNIQVYVPYKANTYNLEDNGKVTRHNLSLEMANNDITYKPNLTDNIWLAVSQPLSVMNEIVDNNDASSLTYNKDLRYVLDYTVKSQIANPSFEYPYKLTQTIKFDKIYDIDEIVSNSDRWKIISKDKTNNTVTFEIQDYTITDFSNSGTQVVSKLPDNNFIIKTIPRLNSSTESVVGGFEVTTQLNFANNYKGYDFSTEQGTINDGYAKSSSTNTSKTFSANGTSEVFASATDNEINDPIDFNIFTTLGMLNSTQTWKQDVVLPYNGDKEQWSIYNSNNGTNDDIELDENAKSEILGDFGNSQFNGTYKVTKIVANGAPVGTKLILYSTHNNAEFSESTKIGELISDENGKFDLSTLNDTQIEQIKGFQLNGKGNVSENQSTGYDLNVQITPTGNRKDDRYMIWPLQTSTSKNDQKVVAWGALGKVYASSLTGYVYDDDNNSSNRNEGEKGFENITVQLIKDGSVIKTVKSGTDGSYTFDEIHSGNYTVNLVNVVRGENQDITAVNESTEEGSETNLKAVEKNRFKVDIHRKQTQSYNKYGKYSSSKATVKVDKKANVKDINFGYFLPEYDLSLDKYPATVYGIDNNHNLAKVRWAITVKNTGNTDISGVSLFDRMSKEINLTSITTGDAEIIQNPNNIVGNRIDTITGFNSEPSRYGLFTGTDKGIWFTYPHTGETVRLTFYENNQDIHLTGQDVVAMQGSRPTVLKVSDGFSGNNNGVVFATKNRLFFCRTYEDPSKYADFVESQKIVDMPQGETVKDLTTLYPYGYGTMILTDSGKAYYADRDGVLSINGIKGTINGMIASKPRDGAAIYTTEGLFVVKKDTTNKTMSVTEIQSTKGKNIVKATGNCPSGLFVSSDGLVYYQSSLTNIYQITTITDMDNISELSNVGTNIKDVTGYDPNNAGWIFTDQGLFVKRKESKIYKRAGISIDGHEIKSISAYDGQYSCLVLTVDGKCYIVPSKETDPIREFNVDGKKIVQINGDDITKSGAIFLADDDSIYICKNAANNYELKKIEGIQGDVQTVFTRRVNINLTERSFYVLTDYASYLGEVGYPDANNITLVKSVIDYQNVAVENNGQNAELAGQPSVESNSDGNNFVNREIKLSRIAAGASISVFIEGTVDLKESEQFLGNQAWVTSSLTPRGGISTSSVSKSGNDGVPGLPILPKTAEEFHYDKIPETEKNTDENNTVNTNSKNGIEDNSLEEDDLADQTPVRIPEYVKRINYVTLKGMAWYDGDNNKKRGTNETKVSGIKVKLLDNNYTLLNETATDSSGNWTFEKVAVGNDYYIQYEVPWTYNEKTWSTVSRVNTSAKAATDDSDVDEEGLSDVISIPSNTSANSTIEHAADLGLYTFKGTSSLVKGAILDTNENQEKVKIMTDKSIPTTKPTINSEAIINGNVNSALGNEVNDGDSNDFTRAFQFKYTNTGNINLTKIKLSDETNTGYSATFNKNFKVIDSSKNEVASGLTLDANGIKDQSGNYYQLEPGNSLIGYIQVPFDIAHLTHKDTLTITATPIQDNRETTSISSTDSFEVSIEKYNIRKTNFIKIDGQTFTKLSGATFVIYQTNASSMQSASINKQSRLVTLSSDISGEFSYKLEPGVYWIEEIQAPSNYTLPTGHWLLQVSVNSDSTLKYTYGSVGNVPYMGNEKINKVDTGNIVIHNTKRLDIPTTGGIILFVFAFGAVSIVIGLWITNRQKKAKENN